MINLLPPPVKSEILYAKRNSILLKWLITMLFIIAAIFIIVIVGQVFLNQNKKNVSAQIDVGKIQLKNQKLEETQTKVKSINESVKLAIDVLSKQLLFSKVLTQIGANMPEGSVLTDLSIGELEGGIDLSAAARDYNTAAQIQINLQDEKNKLFKKADITGEIECKDPATAKNAIEAKYPCSVSIRALFNDKNDFLFISKEKKQ
jgi:hypothetical protein